MSDLHTRRRYIAAAAAAVLALAGCTAGHAPPVDIASTSSTASMTLSPSPTPSPSYQTARAPANGDRLLGSWTSTTDATDTRTFRPDGITTETGGSGAYRTTSTDRWRWIYYRAPYVEDSPTTVSLELTDITNALPNDPLIYGVDYPSPNHLRLVYVGTGRILDYTRVS